VQDIPSRRFHFIQVDTGQLQDGHADVPLDITAKALDIMAKELQKLLCPEKLSVYLQ
jgi:hypothetical protein